MLKENKCSQYGKNWRHIHFGVNIFENDLDKFLLFLKVYAIYENIFFRFYFGEYLCHRRTSYTSNQNMAWKICKNIKDIKSIDDLNQNYCFLRWSREAALNFGNMRFADKDTNKNTIELRIPNGTIEEVIWQNNVNTFAKFILKTLNNTWDLDYINQTFSNLKESDFNTLYYQEIILKKALEFVDLIFDNDLDKFYFLRQYIKNYEDNYNLKENKLAKRFIV